MWEAAGFLGMSEKTLRDTYGHHHPDHLRGAADAIGSRPTPPKNVALVVSLVEEKAKREGALKTPDFVGGPGSSHRKGFLRTNAMVSANMGYSYTNENTNK